jgi:microcystin degradation protein MlrC
MLSQADVLVAYRTYPHIDMAATGERALRALHLIRERLLHGAIAKLPFLIPLTSQCTLVEPLSNLMTQMEAAQSSGVHITNFTPGFAPADVEKCGPAIVVYGRTPDVAAATTRELAELVAAREHEFALETLPIDAALAKIDQLANGPIILADTQDNPGGGGTSDTTSLLRALSQTAHHALCGLMCDPIAARRAHDAGVGAEVELELGGHSGPAGETPLAGRYQVIALGDGNFTATGSFYSGARMALGPMALLRLGNLYIAVSSRKQQAADQAMFRHLGIEPERFPLVVLKSSVHFRADFGSLAHHILVVTAPGMNIADPAELTYAHLPTTMRLAGAARPLRSPK